MSSATLNQCINWISRLATRISRETSTPEVVQELQQCLETLIEVQQLHEELELCLQERTAELSEALAQLQTEMAERLQLQAERSRLLAIVQASADYIGIADEQGNVLWTNRQLQKTSGLSSDADVSHFQIADYHPAWALDIIQQQGIPIALREGVWVGETALLDEHGQEIPVSQMIIAHKSCEGTLDYFSTVMRDIRELKKSQEKIGFQARLLDAVEQAIIAVDLQGHITYWNHFAEILYRWKADEVLGRSILEVTPALNSQAEAAEIMSRLQAGKSWSGEFLVQRRDGTTFPAIIIDSPIYDERGKFNGILGVSLDITERKRAELAIRQSEELFRRLFEFAPIGLIIRDVKTLELIKVNPALCQMLGYTAAELAELSDVEITHPDDWNTRSQFNAEIRCGSKSSYQLQQRFLKKNREIVWMNITGTLIRDSDDTPLYYLGMFEDITERKTAELALVSVSERLQYLLTSSPAVIFSCPPRGDYTATFISQNVKTILGYEAQEFLNSSQFWVQRVHPDDLEEMMSSFPTLSEQESCSYEYRFLHVDGTYHWLYTQISLVKDEAGKPIECVGYLTDISDAYRQAALRKQAEEELRASQRFIQKIADSSPNLLYLYDLVEQRNLYVNREITQMLGYTPEEIQAMGQELFPILMHPDDLVTSAGKIQQINTANDGEIIEFEYRLLHKNGEWRWLYSWDTVFTRNSEGKPTQIVGTATDISDRKHLELALQQSEERFRTCVENLLEPLALFSSVRDVTGQIVDFRYEYINPAGCRANQKPREETIGRTICELLSAHQQSELFDAYCQVVETGEPLIRESFCYEDVYAGERLQRIFDIQAVKLGDGFVATWQDVTERKQTEAQIQTSLKEKDILLREIHHRVKNNLQVIHSLLRLQSSYTADPQTLQMFQDSQNRIRSMALIHEFLYNSQDLAQIDFGAYIQTLVNSLRRTYTVNQNAISWEIQVEPIQLSIDTALPCGLLINELISNALKYAFPAGQPGKIKINLHSDSKNQYTLLIKDNGVGLPPDLDFRNTDSLGLQLVCDSTAQIGGTIEIDRTHGTSFTIQFREIKYQSRK